jgi:hypothetical protein
MTESTAIVTVSDDRFLAPVINLKDAQMRYQAQKEFIGTILHDGVDYGAVPGTDKKTLLKPGAEKMASYFGLTPVFEDMETVEDWTGEAHGGEPFFYYRQKCKLHRGERLIATADGSCNSWEKKYRYRNASQTCPQCGKSAIIKGKKEYGGGWLCFRKNGGCGAKFQDGDKAIENQPVGQMKNPDVPELVNTILKMAQKRALVAATLIATNTSEYFTQDVEDFYNGDVVDVQFVPAQPAKPAAPRTNGKTQPPAPEEPPVDADFSMVGVVTQELGGKAKPVMTLEEAENVTNSEGLRYGDLKDDKLGGMATSINKAMKKTGVTPEQMEQYRNKLQAIDIILDWRNPAVQGPDETPWEEH